MYFFMFNDGGDVVCSGISTQAELVDGAFEVTEDMYQVEDKSIFWLHENSINTRAASPGINFVWTVVADGFAWVIDISKLKAERSAEIELLCVAEIVSGYDSDALGQMYHYPSKMTDQGNMVASVADSLNPENPTGWTTPFWCADEFGNWAFRDHSATQIRRAGAAGKAAIAAAQLKNAQLQAQIASAETERDIDIIAW